MSKNEITKQCKHCMTEIPKKAKVCPNCKRKQGGKGKVILIVLVVLFIIGIFGSDTEENNSNSSSSSQIVKEENAALKKEEIDVFVGKLLEDESIRYCPHGRPVMYELSKHEIEKQFGRI